MKKKTINKVLKAEVSRLTEENKKLEETSQIFVEQYQKDLTMLKAKEIELYKVKQKFANTLTEIARKMGVRLPEGAEATVEDIMKRYAYIIGRHDALSQVLKIDIIN